MTSIARKPAVAIVEDAAEALPPSWYALAQHLRVPFWTVAQTVEATRISRSTLNREWANPRSTFPRPRHVGRRVMVSALAVLRHMEP